MKLNIKIDISSLNLEQANELYSELKRLAVETKTRISVIKSEAVLQNPEFKAAWEEGMSLFQPLWRAWRDSSKENEEFLSLSLKERAALLAAGFKPNSAVQPKFIMIKHDADQDITGWEDAAKVLLSQMMTPELELLKLSIRMAVRKPASDAKPVAKNWKRK